MINNMTSKGQVETLTSGQGHDLTQTYHDAYQSIRIDQTSPSNLFWSLYLVSIKSYCEETVGDQWWRHAISTAHCRGQRCTCQLKWLVNTTFCMIWLLMVVLTQTKMKWNFFHWLIMGGGHTIDLTLGQRYKKSEIYIFYILSPLANPASFNAIGQ